MNEARSRARKHRLRALTLFSASVVSDDGLARGADEGLAFGDLGRPSPLFGMFCCTQLAARPIDSVPPASSSVMVTVAKPSAVSRK